MVGHRDDISVDSSHSDIEVVEKGAIPFGILGTVIGHILLGYDLSLISIMGVIALSGVLVNDSLIMIDYSNRQRSERNAVEAIHRPRIRRFILTTFGGLTPSSWRPPGRPLI